MTDGALGSALSTLLQRLREGYPDVERMALTRTLDLPVEPGVDRLRVEDAPGGLRVSVGAEGDGEAGWRLVHDQGARRAEVREEVAAALQAAHPALVAPLVGAFTGDYKGARTDLDKAAVDDATQREFRAVVTRDLLADRSLEWTVHGPQRCFRFWSPEEKTDYVRHAAQAARDLAELSPNVCFGFGAALSVVRDGDLIPHDDDLDLIIGFDPDEAATLPDALKLVEQHMRAKGYVVRGNFMAHRHVTVSGKKHVDVFVGLFEGDTIAWYPGKRGTLTRDIMFPTTTRPLLGVDCPLPAQPEVYLERLYGPTWHTPDPHFRHTWDSAAYADQRRRPAPPATAAATPATRAAAAGGTAATGTAAKPATVRSPATRGRRVARRLAGGVRRRLRRLRRPSRR